MRFLPVVLAGWLVALPLPAQDHTGQIRGVVTGTLGDLVDGAEIRLVGTDHSATTDPKGWFAIRGLAKGHYIAEVQRIGFKAQRLGASVEDGEVLGAGSAQSDRDDRGPPRTGGDARGVH